MNKTQQIMYSIEFKNRHTEYVIRDTKTNEPTDRQIQFPNNHHLFHEDVFDYDHEKQEVIAIVHSPLREKKDIAGVLILAKQKTYGRLPNMSSKNTNKLLYAVVPYDTNYPLFLVPYEMKTIGFSKSFSNFYVTFEYAESSKTRSTMPIGRLKQVIGPVDNLHSYYEYEIYARGLHHSIQPSHQ
jgi:hypothetical protein